MDSIAWRNGNPEVALEPLDQRWRTLFTRYDLDHDGKIEVHEFIEILRANSNNEIPPHFIRHLMQAASKGGSSHITYPDFVRLINDRNPRNAFQRVFLHYTKSIIPPRSKRVLDLTDGEYEDEYTCTPPTIFMLLISIIEIALYIADAFLSSYPKSLGPIADLLMYNPHRRAEVWRFVTYMFVHIGSFHLIVNVIVQLLLGVPLEMVHRWWRVLLVYFAGVLAGSLGTTISDPSVRLAGASGGVYALMAAHIATIILNWSEMRFAFWQLLVFLLIILSDVGTAIYSRYTGAEPKVGYVAHLGGALAGLLIGLYVLRNLEVLKWEKKVSKIAALLFLTAMAGITIFNIVDPAYFPSQDQKLFTINQY